MARTQDEIKKSIIETIQNEDASVEVDYGPLLDGWINPITSEFATEEARADELSQFYSTSYIKGATEDTVKTYVTNFALPEGQGKFSKGQVIFATYTRLAAGELIVIPVGTLVANSDNTKIYRVSEERQIEGDFISNYYNATKAWYEIAVPIEATVIGKEYDLPVDRIRQLLTPIPGINVVLNRSSITGGRDAEDKERMFERVENAFLGQDKGSISGLVTRVESYDPDSISAVAVVRINERKLFTRFTDKLGIDIYVDGVVEESLTEDYAIDNTTYSIILKKQPVVAVTSVFVNNVEVAIGDYALEKDDTAYSDSTLSKDKVVFRNVLLPGSVVTITYSYNVLLTNIDEDVFGDTEDDLFSVDALVRQMITKEFDIAATLSFSSSANTDAVLSEVNDLLVTLINTKEPGAVYQPEVLRQTIVSQVSGLSELAFTRFTLLNESNLAVETVSLPKNAVANLSEDNITLRG